MPVMILVCGSVQCAGEAGAEPLCRVATERMKALGVRGEVHSVKCLEICQRGPHVSVHGAGGDVPETARAPDGGVAYDGVTTEGMARIVDEHVQQQRPVMELLHQDRPQFQRGK